MTPADLSRIETLAREATPGEWKAMGYLPWRVENGDRPTPICGCDNVANAAYIAAANPAAVLALIERVRELEAEIERRGAILRVNLLRADPNITHADIDHMLENKP
jgi:hypothetical protein